MTGTRTKIMLGFNLYFTSEEVTQVAIEHCKKFDAKLLVVSSITGHSQNELGEIENEDARRRLNDLKATLEQAGVDYEVHMIVRRTSPGADLVRFALEHDVYEMVIGFKKRSQIGEIVFGSNYRHMIANAHCPVVTVHVRDEDND